MVIFFLILLTISSWIATYFIYKKKEGGLIQTQAKEKVGIRPTTSNITYKDVAGLNEAKKALSQITSFMQNPQKYKKLNARIPKGIILSGPPGVGKTLLAKSVAGEAKVPFYYQSGANLVEIYVGMGAKRVKELFNEAKKNRPSIIFIDEIDAIGKERSGIKNEERESTLNQLLTEMDGFEDSNGVVVIAATNKLNMLDSALLRAGRFDRSIKLILPELNDRVQIIKTHLSNRSNSLDIDELAKLTSGFSAASIENLINEAALHAVENGKDIILKDDIEAIKDNVMYGIEEQNITNLKDREKIATIQAAKAVIANKLKLDFEQIKLNQSKFLSPMKTYYLLEDIQNRFSVYLGARVASELFFGNRFAYEIKDNKEILENKKLLKDTFLLDDNQVNNILKDAELISKKIIETNKSKILDIKNELLNNELYIF